MKKSLFAFLILMFPVTSLLAEQKEVVATGKAVISEEVTLNQAKQQALNHARSRAVEQAAGISVNSSLVVQNALVVSELIETFSKGFIINEQILEWQSGWIKNELTHGPGTPVVSVKIKALVEVPSNLFFHNYALDAKLNKQTFLNGESVTLQIAAKEDMYFIVVNYTSDNKIIPIFPFDQASNNQLKSNSSLDLPGALGGKYEITVNTFPGHQQDIEAFIVFGFPIDEHTNSITWSNILKQGETISYPRFTSILLNLPIKWIAEKIVTYSVVAE